MPNVYFLQGDPVTDEQMAQKTSIQGALYLSNDVSGNSNSNRLYIGRTNTAGGIKPIVTPTPFKQIIQFNGATKSSFDGTADVTTNIQAVSLVSSTNNALARFDGTGGFIKNSTAILSDEGHLSISGKINSKGDITIGSMDGDTVVGAGNFKIGVKNDSYGVMPYANNQNSIGASNLYWYRAYINNYYGTTAHITNYDSNGNIGAAATTNAASTLGYINFYNNTAAGATQTKTKLTATQSKEMLQPGARGGMITGPSNFPGYRGQ